MSRLSTLFLKYAVKNMPKDNFEDTFFYNCKMLDLKRIRRTNLPHPPVIEDRLQTTSLVNNYLEFVTRGNYRRDIAGIVHKVLSDYLKDPRVLTILYPETLCSILSYYRRIGDVQSLTDFVENKVDHTTISRSHLAYNFLLYSLPKASQFSTSEKASIAMLAVDKMDALKIPAPFSTWRCIYQLLGFQSSEIVLNKMVSEGMNIESILWRVMEKSKQVFHSAPMFIEFVLKHPASFPTFNQNGLLMVYCFYNDLDGISREVDSLLKRNAFRFGHLKTLTTRLLNNNQIYSVISMVNYCEEHNIPIAQKLRQTIFHNMLDRYLTSEHADLDSEFSAQLVRYLYVRSEQSKRIVNKITKIYGSDFFAKRPMNKTRFARYLNDGLRWKKVTLKLEDNTPEYQEVVKKIYPGLEIPLTKIL